MQIVPFEPLHIRLLSREIINNDHLIFAKDPDAVFDMAQKYADSGLSFTGLDGGRVLGFAGIVEFWKGVGEAWCMLAVDALPKRLAVIRAIYKGLQHIQEDLRLHRVQATVNANNVKSRDLLSWLGFEEEGPLEMYGPNRELFLRYRKLFP